MSTESVPVSRRQRRRLETIEEVLDVAVAVMTEHGVAGLSVGEVARRMGIQPPSLYGYFPSKHSLYDALFTRGAQLLLDEMQDAELFAHDDGEPLEATLLVAGRTFVGWAIAHPAYSQLLFWRPVPGFAPSPAAYEPAVKLVALGTNRFADLQQRTLIRGDVAADDVMRDWTVLIAGVISQQLSNAPEESLDTGRFTSALPRNVAMFAAYFEARPTPPTKPRRARNGSTR